MKKDIFEIIKTEEGRKELQKVISDTLPLILDKRKKEGFYSLDKKSNQIGEL